MLVLLSRSDLKNNLIKEITMADEKTCETKKCPIGGFCWKNPTHWFLFLAILPFTVVGVTMVVNVVHNLVGTVVGK
jgi:hypothetical protein